MYRFTNDYSEAAHPAILQAIAAANTEGNFGYGADPYTARAGEIVRTLCAAPGAAVHFLVGGTQTNLTAIAAFLRPHQAVIAAATGHVCVHETGAIEATGHKCIAMPTPDGKLTPALLRAAVAAHPDEHMVQPKLVYISNTTELGGIYTTAELEALRAAPPVRPQRADEDAQTAQTNHGIDEGREDLASVPLQTNFLPGTGRGGNQQ